MSQGGGSNSGGLPHKAEIVGSLLRPKAIFEAREKRAAGDLSAEALWDIEAKCVADVVDLQKNVGLLTATDGEFHRRHWFLDFLERIDGIAFSGGLPTKFHNEKGTIDFAPPRMEVRGKLKRSQPIVVDEFKSLNAVTSKAGLTAKQAIPSPMCVHFRGGRKAIDATVYPDIEDFFTDLIALYREEMNDLYAAGCRYLQVDDTNFPYLCDPKLRDNVRAMGEDPDTLPALYVRLMNMMLDGKPDDLTVVMHMCRGNHQSSWVAEGDYEAVAEAVFSEINLDGYFLEYDSPRAGGFAPLRFLNKNKVAVLGLVTTKKPDLESKDELKRRIEEASKYVPLDRLSLSPQCGFASVIEGNDVTVDDEIKKLELVVETATEVWGHA